MGLHDANRRMGRKVNGKIKRGVERKLYSCADIKLENYTNSLRTGTMGQAQAGKRKN